MPCLSLLPTDRPSEQRFCDTRLWDALARHEFIWRRNSRDSRLEFVERDARCPHGGVWGPRRPRAASGPSAAGRAAERSRAPSGESSVWRDGGRGRGTAVNGTEPARRTAARRPAPAPGAPRARGTRPGPTKGLQSPTAGARARRANRSLEIRKSERSTAQPPRISTDSGIGCTRISRHHDKKWDPLLKTTM